ncbi:MAG: hypothetical protein HYZ14_00485 [Bacteroidetes bacterium]|nr:hypothetical protein [Bacteroidota bacterium]
MSDQVLDSNGGGTGARPTFLTVLCILTFIGSGLGVLGGILGLVGSSALARFAPSGGLMIWTLLGLAAAGLCLFGAIQMWGLKKQGFMLYVAGVALSIVVSLINVFTMPDLGGSALGSSVESAMWTGVFIGVAINVAFVLMYNANRKALIH